MSVLDDIPPPDRADTAPVTGPLRELLAALTVPGGERPRISIELDEDGWRALEAQFRRPFRPHSSYKLLPLETGVVAFQRKREPEVAEVCGARPALDSGDAWACPAPTGHALPHRDYTGKPWPQYDPLDPRSPEMVAYRAKLADHEMEWPKAPAGVDPDSVYSLCARPGCGRPPNEHPINREKTGWTGPPAPGPLLSISMPALESTTIEPPEPSYNGAWRERK